MRIPKWFEKWFGSYGIMDDATPFWASGSVKRIAWRAYRKGKKDGAKQYSIDLEDLIKELEL